MVLISSHLQEYHHDFQPDSSEDTVLAGTRNLEIGPSWAIIPKNQIYKANACCN